MRKLTKDLIWHIAIIFTIVSLSAALATMFILGFIQLLTTALGLI